MKYSTLDPWTYSMGSWWKGVREPKTTYQKYESSGTQNDDSRLMVVKRTPTKCDLSPAKWLQK
ncbi:MAG: hypothetical protein DMG36_11485, partial [Acidobacteria bacterium]